MSSRPFGAFSTFDALSPGLQAVEPQAASTLPRAKRGDATHNKALVRTLGILSVASGRCARGTVTSGHFRTTITIGDDFPSLVPSKALPSDRYVIDSPCLRTPRSKPTILWLHISEKLFEPPGKTSS